MLDARGECGRVEEVATSWYLADPEHWAPPIMLAGVRLRRGAEPSGVKRLIEEYQARAAASQLAAENAPFGMRSYLMYLGDFASVDALDVRLDAGCAGRARCHAEVWQGRIANALERGRVDESVALLEEAARRSGGWIGPQDAATASDVLTDFRAALAVAHRQPLPPEVRSPSAPQPRGCSRTSPQGMAGSVGLVDLPHRARRCGDATRSSLNRRAR
jgi:hypothetical protein